MPLKITGFTTDIDKLEIKGTIRLLIIFNWFYKYYIIL